MRLIKNELYKIDWIDIVHQGSWTNNVAPILDEAMQGVTTYGLFLKKATRDKTIFYLFTSGKDNHDNTAWDCIVIPKSVIKKITKV